MATYTDESYACPRPCGVGPESEEITKENRRGTPWTWVQLSGEVYCPNGVVRATATTAYEGDTRVIYTSFLFANANGRSHTRRFNKAYSGRYLVTLANRFINELTEKEE